MMLSLLLSFSVLQDADEAAYYAVDYLTPPEGEVLEVGGMDFLPNGKLVLSTRRGQVWIVEDPLAEDPADATFRLFCEGLWEGLGLTVVEGQIYVVQRGELSRLVDVDDDGVCDRVETITDGWGLSGNYHEFAFGLPVDDEGHFYVSLNVGFFSPKWWHGVSVVPWRGWVLRISPEGRVEPVACGFRSPAGIDMDAKGNLFVTDNQGDWMASSPIFHVKPGRFYGHPASLAWTPEYRASQAEVSDTVPPARANDRAPAAVWLPYKWSRSPGNLVPDTTGGVFGPFGNQMILAELTNGMLLRVGMQEVRGELQGWAIPFRQQVGSAYRVRFAPDGSLFVGMTNRGWGGLAPASGIARVRWTGATPMEIHDVRLVSGGFELDFTRPLAEADLAAEAVKVVQYDYDYWWEYGSPERDMTELAPTAIEVSDDRRSLRIALSDLEAGRMARLTFFDLAAEGGDPLLHNEVAYTVNQLVDGAPTTRHVSRIVPPPPARTSGEEGWLRLTYGDATSGWDFEGWELVDAELDPDDPTRLAVRKGVNALTNTASETPTNYVSKLAFGDADVHVEFMLPEGGVSGVIVHGYEVRLADCVEAPELGTDHCGALVAGPGTEARAPAHHAYKGAGQWHDLDLVYEGARFSEAGKQVREARFSSISLDGTVIHEDVVLGGEVDGPSLVLRGDRGHVAFGNIRLKPRGRQGEPGEKERAEGWRPLWTEDDDDLGALGWTATGEALWTLEDGVLVGEGNMGHLFSPRGDYRDVQVRARVKIAEGGNSGLYFRATPTAGWPDGYEAQVNSSFADPQKTGSLYGLAPVTTHLVPPDTWFDYEITCRDTDAGTRVVIRVNGIVVTDHVDAERRWPAGHLAIQQHHEGSVIEVMDLEVRELE